MFNLSYFVLLMFKNVNNYLYIENIYILIIELPKQDKILYNENMIINNDTIVKDDDPIIREKSLNVNTPLSQEDETLLMEMLQYVKDSTDEELAEKLNLRPAVGISAIQVGVKKKMCAIALRDSEGNFMCEYALANPRIVSESLEVSYLRSGEGCLSVPVEHEGYVPRHARIKVKAYDAIAKKDIELKLNGYLAIVFQHEIDHFSGTLFYDRINKQEPFKEIEEAFVIE